jgi:hypothetical protein
LRCKPIAGGRVEVDFHDLWVILGGIKTKTVLITMRLSCSGRPAHRALLSQGQEALGWLGVPSEQIRYDNLNPRYRGLRVRWLCPPGLRTGSVSGRPAPLPRSRSPSVARCDTRSTAVVLARVR